MVGAEGRRKDFKGMMKIDVINFSKAIFYNRYVSFLIT